MPRKPVSTKSAPRASFAAKPKAVAQAVKPTAAPAKSKPAAGKTPISAAPSTEQISKRAYEIWLRNGRPLGQDTKNWLEAEAELKAKR